jgi:DNA topoisomerase-1
VKSKEKVEKLTNLGPAGDEWKCPKCTHAMIIKLGRGGKFMSCERYPDCDGARMIDGNVIEPDKPIGTDAETNLPIFVMNGRFGPYVQLGEKTKEHPKPRRASIPKDKDLGTITVPDALTYLSLPRALGVHPDTGEMITASIGRFGPYIVHQKDFRSLKTDDVYSIDLKRALEILKEEKKVGRRGRAKAPIKTTEKKK